MTGSSSAAVLLGARPIPSIATTPGARFRGSRACARQPCFESLFAAARDGTAGTRRPRLSRTGAGSTMTVTSRSPPRRRTCSSTPITRTPSQRIGSCSSSSSPAARRRCWPCASKHQDVWRCWPWRRGRRSARPGPTALPRGRARLQGAAAREAVASERLACPGFVASPRAPARRWGGSRRAHGPGGGPPIRTTSPGIRTVDTTAPARRWPTATSPKSSNPPKPVRSTRAKARLGHVGALL